MEKTVKRLTVEGGRLFTVVEGRRLLLAECEAEVKLHTNSVGVPILGKGRIITERGAALLVTFRHRPSHSMDESMIDRISRFEFQGDILQTDGGWEQVLFERCQLVSDLDLTAAGTCQFELMCPPELLRRLLAM